VVRQVRAAGAAAAAAVDSAAVRQFSDNSLLLIN